MQPGQDQWGSVSNAPTFLATDSSWYAPRLPYKHRYCPFSGTGKPEPGAPEVMSSTRCQHPSSGIAAISLEGFTFESECKLYESLCACAHAFSPRSAVNEPSLHGPRDSDWSSGSRAQTYLIHIQF